MCRVTCPSFKVKPDNFFGLTLSLWCMIWFNSVIVVEKWHQLLLMISNKLCFYHEIFFATGTRVSLKSEKSVTLSVLSVLIRRSTLSFLATGDFGTSWLAHRALTRLCQQQSVCESHRQLARARAETDQFTPLQLSLQPFGLSSNWT